MSIYFGNDPGRMVSFLAPTQIAPASLRHICPLTSDGLTSNIHTLCGDQVSGRHRLNIFGSYNILDWGEIFRFRRLDPWRCINNRFISYTTWLSPQTKDLGRRKAWLSESHISTRRRAIRPPASYILHQSLLHRTKQIVLGRAMSDEYAR